MKLDEFTIGEVFETKSYQLTKEDILQFAGEFDPQYMHVDEEKANAGMFKGIIASGIHTLAISFKLWVEAGKFGEDIIAGTKMNNLNFLKPVYPDDELHTIVEVIDKKALKNDSGLLSVALSTYNDKGEKVLEVDITAMLKR